MGKEITNVTITDNTGLVREALARATRQALAAIGTTAERYVKENMTYDTTPPKPPIDTGLLRNSMTYVVSGEEAHIKNYKADKGDESGEYSGTAPATPKNTVYVGTNVEYGVFIEEGTGIHAAGNKGRKDPWVYTDEKTGKKRVTAGYTARHMIRRAVTEHTDEYREIVKQTFKANE
ncbi:MAG: hypothetical protein K2J73_08555 [Oscillospiraceae bacterium]|nr:hypothetical protein [Oscillospiraceae bacterium]